MSEMNIDWQSLGFQYMDTNAHIRYVWRDGAWSEGELVAEPHLQIHIAATALHYGQAVFEGLKAFTCRDGQIRMFRPQENARRMAVSARRLRMMAPPEELFLDACQRVVKANREFVPPYGTGGSLYIRPLLIGSGPQIGVSPADEYVFLVLVTPVGAYYKGGLTPVRAIVLENYDRAAPQGVGNAKVAGNYAASLEPHHVAHGKGFPVELYLDAREHRYVEEFGTSNFIAITQDGTYVSAQSSSILASITNKGLQQIAADLGHRVEVRPIEFSEVESFAEVAACGTAVVITPVNEIVRNERVVRVGPQEGCGPVFEKIYTRYRAIQVGDIPDPYGWTVPVHFPDQ
ncbi:MAG: branched-chain amino acid aminotransferase [Victivallales bacterium]|nr:branched-chain amino acid aminotransferase [Victivallales bacterium]MBT7161582.1 branched-chain amino acid aminotransferase [Victivallales bacterium]MBT7301781.1 branched-chain amino acid aminotransferase [Victivallales bacterium]